MKIEFQVFEVNNARIFSLCTVVKEEITFVTSEETESAPIITDPSPSDTRTSVGNEDDTAEKGNEEATSSTERIMETDELDSSRSVVSESKQEVETIASPAEESVPEEPRSGEEVPPQPGTPDSVSAQSLELRVTALTTCLLETLSTVQRRKVALADEQDMQDAIAQCKVSRQSTRMSSIHVDDLQCKHCT